MTGVESPIELQLQALRRRRDTINRLIAAIELYARQSRESLLPLIDAYETYRNTPFLVARSGKPPLGD
jgi:hypothetical protein